MHEPKSSRLLNTAQYSRRLQEAGVSKRIADAQADALEEALDQRIPKPHEFDELLSQMHSLLKLEVKAHNLQRHITITMVLLCTALLANVLIPMLK